MMQHEGHVRILKSLKLFGMAHAIEELGNQNSPAFNQALPMLDSLIKAEVAEREVRSVNYQLRVAKFPVYRDLVGFDFSQSLVNEATVKQLHRCDFMEQAQNVVLIGGPGTGKTHRHSHWYTSSDALEPTGAFLLHRGFGQCTGAREIIWASGTNRKPSVVCRFGDSG